MKKSFDDFDNVGSDDPPNVETLSETTQRYDSAGRMQYRTLWRSARGQITPADVEIAGIGATTAADDGGVTTQYVYFKRLVNSGFVSPPGWKSRSVVRVTSSAGGNVDLTEAIDKAGASPSVGGAGAEFDFLAPASGTVVIATDEETMSVSIADGLGRTVLSGTMTGPAAETPNELINWTCSSYDLHAASFNFGTAGGATAALQATDATAAPIAASGLGANGGNSSSFEVVRRTSFEWNEDRTVQQFIQSYSYTDSLGRSVGTRTQTEVGDVFTRTLYDSGGNPLESYDQAQHKTTYGYDPIGRQTSMVRYSSEGDITTETEYFNETGRVKSRTNGKGVEVTYEPGFYDKLGRMLIVRDREGKDTIRKYDREGNLELITDANQVQTKYTYDRAGRKIRTEYDSAGTPRAHEFRYDGAGRMVVAAMPSGRARVYDYAFSGVLQEIRYYEAGDGFTLSSWDDGNENGGATSGPWTESFEYDPVLRRDLASNSRDRVQNSYVYDYDSDGLLATTETTRFDLDGVGGYESTFDVVTKRDEKGRSSSVTYPSSSEAAYNYTLRGSLHQINLSAEVGSQGPVTASIEQRNYNQVGLLAGIQRGSGNIDNEVRGYDDFNRIQTIQNPSQIGTATYDNNHNKIEEEWSAGPLADWGFYTGDQGGYDKEDRFLKFQYNSAGTIWSWDRDDIGNIQDISWGSGAGAPWQDRSYTGEHRLQTSSNQVFLGDVPEQYDDDGNQTRRHTGSEYSWDSAGRMTSANAVDGGNSLRGIEGLHQYGYDSSGRRAWKKIEIDGVPQWRVFLYSGPNCIAEYLVDSTNPAQPVTPDREYVYGTTIDSLAMILKDGNRYSVTRNQQWSITGLIDYSDGGLVEAYAYDMFGLRILINQDGSLRTENGSNRLAESEINPYGYTSRRHDEETGLMYFRARFYDPATGEFISRDPLEYADGMSFYRGYFVPNYVDPLGATVLAPGQVWHGPQMGPLQVSIYYGPWQCRQEWLDYCKEKCKKRGLKSRGCVWVADIRMTMNAVSPLSPIKHITSFEAVTYCCCEYKRCSRKIREASKKSWRNYRPKLWRDIIKNWGGGTMTTPKGKWPVHHVDPRQFGGHPTVPENLIPLPPNVHSDVHYAYRVCDGKTAGNVDYSKPGKDWPHTGGRPGMNPRRPVMPGIPGAPGTGWGR